MTTTTSDTLSSRDSGAIRPEDTIQVEIWGPPGSGKSVLLVSLVETLRKKRELLDFHMTKELLDLRDKLLKGSITEQSKPKTERDQAKLKAEEVSFDLVIPNGKARRIRVMSNAGEDLQDGGGFDVQKFTKARAGTVFVACLNPFKIDAEMAWKGLNHLIAIHQSRGMNLPDAFHFAIWTLLQIQQQEMENFPVLGRLLSDWQDTRITYDPEQTEPERRFAWTNIDQGNKEELVREIRDLIESNISGQALMVDVVWQAMRHIESAVVVLTHVDLIDALLPSITFTDLDRVYSYLFQNRPDRMVNQQSVARLFHVALANPTSSMGFGGSDGADPTTLPPNAKHGSSRANGEPLNVSKKYGARGISQRLRTDGAGQLVEYLRSIAIRGTEPAIEQVNRLRRALDNTRLEMQEIQLKQKDLDGLLAATRSQLEQEHLTRTRFEADAAKLASQLGDKSREFELLMSQSAVSATERQQLTSDLQQTNTRLADLQAQLTDEQQRHNDTRVSSEKSQLDLEEIARSGSISAKIEELRIMTGERDNLVSKIVAMEAEVQKVDPDVARIRQERDQVSAQLNDAKSEIQTSLSRIRALEGQMGKAPGLREIEARDAVIDEQRNAIIKKESDISQLQKTLKDAQAGRISMPEAQQRDAYEQGRMGATKTWSLYMLRALPALPFLAVGVDQITGAHRFAFASLISVAVVGLAFLASLGLQLLQIPVRWIWLRSMSMTTPRTLEALTSAGERLTSSPGNFTLERSPLLALLGMAVIRRNDSAQRYVTTEPGAWIAAPERPATRWLLMLDVFTIFVISIWILTMYLKPSL